jgi:hypothetical protein
MAWSVIDLSSITDELIALLTDSFATNSPVWTTNGGTIDPFDVTISGAMPETVRGDGACKLSLYLLHASQDKFYRNTPVPGPYPQTNRKNPLSLDLYYLLTAYAKDNYNQEQQAMSVALRCFHENAIVTKPSATKLPGHATEVYPTEHYTLSMEVETADEMARLWQALSTPLRLSVVYKVSVAFITPSELPLVPQKPPESVGLAVGPMGTSSKAPARLFGAAVRESFIAPPNASAGDAEAISYVAAPGLVRPGDDLIVTGDGLDHADFAGVYLSTPDGATEFDVTDWRQLPVSGTDLRLRFPKATGTPKAASLAPGIYRLSVGSDAPKKTRSNVVPISVAAFIDDTVTPPALSPHHLDADASGVYTVKGIGFTTALTQVFVGDAALARITTKPPDQGQFVVDPTETSFQFKRPASLAKGTYEVRVRVNQVDSPPAWTIDV